MMMMMMRRRRRRREEFELSGTSVERMSGLDYWLSV
jgi:hypothetical protein